MNKKAVLVRLVLMGVKLLDIFQPSGLCLTECDEDTRKKL